VRQAGRRPLADGVPGRRAEPVLDLVQPSPRGPSGAGDVPVVLSWHTGAVEAVV
jgi:hypothetical protein